MMLSSICSSYSIYSHKLIVLKISNDIIDSMCCIKTITIYTNTFFSSRYAFTKSKALHRQVTSKQEEL